MIGLVVVISFEMNFDERRLYTYLYVMILLVQFLSMPNHEYHQVLTCSMRYMLPGLYRHILELSRSST
jgi:hypothetical protein